MQQTLAPLMPELLLLLSAVAVLIAGAFLKNGSGTLRSLIKIELAVVVAALFTLVQLWNYHATVFGGLLVIDTFGTTAKAIVLLAGLFTLALLHGASFQQKWISFETPVLIVLALCGMLLMISANHLLSFYVALELMSLSLYILAGIDRDNGRSSEAALKYFVLGALASGLFLLGCSLVYGFSGGVAGFEGLAALLADPAKLSLGLLLGIVLILVALFFKVSAVPFHMWTPDVYQGAPTVVTAFFATAPKVAVIAVLLRFLMQPLLDIADSWQQITYVVALLTMLLGAIAALRQSNIKRMLAYSSIGHVGYLLVGITAGNITGIQSSLVYTLIYVVMTAGMFGLLLNLRRGKQPVEALDDFKGLATREPLIAAVVSVFMLSMAGIPPLAGFFGKFYVFLAAIEEEYYVLATIGVLSSVIAAYYYLRIIKLMYFDEVAAPLDAFNLPRAHTLVVGFAAAFNLLFFLQPSLLIQLAREAARTLIR